MKRIIITILLLLPLSLAAQQRIHAFVSSGVNISQIEGDELKGFKQIGYTGGVGALVSLSSNNHWGMSIEALFSQRGARSTRDTRNYLYYLDVHSNYIEIPLLLHWQDQYGGMLFGAGVSYGRLVRQPVGKVGLNENFFVPDTNDKDFLPNDFMVVADARFTIWRGLQLNLRWQYSIIAVKRDWHFKYVDGKNPDGTDRWIDIYNNCYNHSIALRLIWQF
jgi:hypothetical protein